MLAEILLSPFLEPLGISFTFDKEKIKGNRFEEKTADLIKAYTGVYPVRNVILPNGRGSTTECDMVFVTKKGVFAVECKESGAKSIGGSIDNAVWLRGRNDLYNPVWQNEGHITALRKVLHIPAWKIKNIVSTSCDVHVSGLPGIYRNYYTDGSRRFIVSAGDRKAVRKMFSDIRYLPDILSWEEIKSIESVLKCYKGTLRSRRHHEESMKQRERKNIW